MDTNKNLDDKVFDSYNEITKYFDVKVIMKSNGKYTIELTKKKDGTKEPSKLDKLIKMFLEFKNNQEAFNKMVIEQFKKHAWIK